MSWAIQVVIALAIFLAGAAGGVKWELGVQARAELAAQKARESDALQQRRFSDKQAGDHAQELDQLNKKLGNAREKIALLSNRECLDGDTVGLLNNIGANDVPAAPGNAASAAAAAPAGTGIRFATVRDTAGAIATCRTQYAEVSDQLNKILDIEDARDGVRR